MILNILLFISISWTSWAVGPKSAADFSSSKCQTEFQELLKNKSWDKEKFRPHVADSYQESIYRNLSTKIGEWIDIKLIDKKSPEIYLLKNNAITHYRYNSFCTLITESKSWPWHLEKIFSTPSTQNWDNDNLTKLVSSGKRGMIYNWSPRFSYSVYDLPRMKKLAEKHGYEFTAVVDPRASSEEIIGALEVMNSKINTSPKMKRNVASQTHYFRNVSTDLYMRNGFNHFPTTYIYNKNQIHSRWIVGIMTDQGLKAMADTLSIELGGK